MEKLKTIIEGIRKKVRKKKWQCMSPACNTKTIKSHVLQKNGILNQISKDKHLIQPFVPSLFSYDKKNIIELGKVGLNKAFTFPGFCNQHDTEIFKPIESRNINFNAKKIQLLFSYRALCQEIWRKCRFIEICKLLKPQISPLIYQHLEFSKFGSESGLRNLQFFKREIELELAHSKNEIFEFQTIEIPRIDICISIPLNIGHNELIKENINTHGNYLRKWEIVNTSFLNIFPFQDKLIVIIGYHKKYPCDWIKELVRKLSMDDFEFIQKTISDLMTVRLDYWCMSPYLWKSLSFETQKKIKSLYTKNFYNTNIQIETQFNLFKGIKTAYNY